MAGGGLAWDAATSYARAACTALVAFLMVPWMLAALGTESFGLWSLCFSVLAVFGLFDAGLGVAAVKYVAEARGHGDVGARNRALGVILAAYLALSAVAAGILLIMQEAIVSALTIPESLHATTIELLWILGARAVFLALPLSLFRAVLFGEKHIALINGVNGIATLAYGLCVWWALRHGYGLLAIAYLNLAAMLVEHVVYILFVWWRVPSCRFLLQGVSLAEFQRVASFSSYQLLVNIASMILLQMDLVLIKYFLPLSAVALYAIPLRIVTQAQAFVKQFVNVLSPYTSELHGAGRHNEIATLFLRSSQWVALPGAALLILTCLFGERALVLWVGEEFADAYPILVILMAAAAGTLPCLVAANILTLTEGHRYTAWSAVAGVALNLIVSVVLLPSIGLIGVALGTLASAVVSSWALITRRICVRYGIKPRIYCREVLQPLLMPSLVMLLSAWTLHHIVVAPVLSSALFLAAYWFDRRRYACAS